MGTISVRREKNEAVVTLGWEKQYLISETVLGWAKAKNGKDFLTSFRGNLETDSFQRGRQGIK